MPSNVFFTIAIILRDARRRRRIPAAILAERASSRMTFNKIEKGDAGVYVGNYAAVLFALGLMNRPSASESRGAEENRSLPRKDDR
jgi:hypothetical protein